MALTEAQRVSLAAHIRANTDQNVVDALAIRNDTELTRLYNLDSLFYVYRPSVTIQQIGAAFDWSEVEGNTSVENERLNVFRAYFEESVDPSRQDIRAFFDGVFSGAGGTNTRASLADLWVRFATVAESVFASGVGTIGDPGALDFIGFITTNDVGMALNENP